MAALRYREDMGLEERAIFLTERLAALDQVKEWKHVIKMELAQPEYPVDQVQSLRRSTTLEDPLTHCLLEKMGLLGLIKRMAIDLHCEVMQSAAAASKIQAKQTADDGCLLPETQLANGCSLDVVRVARENWEKITSDEMLRLAKELGRPLIVHKTSVGSETAARDDGQTAGPEGEGTKPSKSNRISAARFLYDG